MKLPRGIRNNNPGNIRHGDPWQGLSNKQSDRDFCTFVNPAYGIRALARTLITYQDKYNLRSIRAIISRWAPPVENDTESYVAAVASQCKRNADEPLDMQKYKDLKPLAEAIIRHENGLGSLKNINTWYDEAVIIKGLELAGVTKPTKTVSKVPVTKETVSATATAGVGVSQLAEVAPAVVDAIKNAQDGLTSGQVSRIVIGLVLVGLAVFIAWSQTTKHKSGLL